jgi:hypothetical protein
MIVGEIEVGKYIDLSGLPVGGRDSQFPSVAADGVELDDFPHQPVEWLACNEVVDRDGIQ